MVLVLAEVLQQLEVLQGFWAWGFRVQGFDSRPLVESSYSWGYAVPGLCVAAFMETPISERLWISGAKEFHGLYPDPWQDLRIRSLYKPSITPM